ncbi:MAG: hypothetical protein FWG58_01560, partial [Methanomassiliicoccaceae archaeon]|nr:hypothetical protein [Methanomassiliicoccaceae archaeon]
MHTSPIPDGDKKNLIFAALIAVSFIFAALPFIIADTDTENGDAVLAAGPAGPSSTATWDFTSADADGSGTYGSG